MYLFKQAKKKDIAVSCVSSTWHCVTGYTNARVVIMDYDLF